MTKKPIELDGVPGVEQLWSQENPVVYFLCLSGKIVYVGQTVNLLQRVRSHGDKVFDSVFFVSVEKDQLLKTEAKYIRQLKPPYNRTLSAKRDPLANAEFVAELLDKARSAGSGIGKNYGSVAEQHDEIVFAIEEKKLLG